MLPPLREDRPAPSAPASGPGPRGRKCSVAMASARRGARPCGAWRSAGLPDRPGDRIRPIARRKRGSLSYTDVTLFAEQTPHTHGSPGAPASRAQPSGGCRSRPACCPKGAAAGPRGVSIRKGSGHQRQVEQWLTGTCIQAEAPFPVEGCGAAAPPARLGSSTGAALLKTAAPPAPCAPAPRVWDPQALSTHPALAAPAAEPALRPHLLVSAHALTLGGRQEEAEDEEAKPWLLPGPTRAPETWKERGSQGPLPTVPPALPLRRGTRKLQLCYRGDSYRTWTEADSPLLPSCAP